MTKKKTTKAGPPTPPLILDYYTAAHGKAPGGTRNWTFTATRRGVGQFSHDGTYAAAKRALAEHDAAIDGAVTWVVLP